MTAAEPGLTSVTQVYYDQIRRRHQAPRDCGLGHIAFATVDRDGHPVWVCRRCPAYADFGTGQAWRRHP